MDELVNIRALRYSRLFWIACAAALAWIAWLLSLPPRPAAWLVALSGTPILVAGSLVAARVSNQPTWRAFVRQTVDLHLLLVVLLLALGVQFADAHGVTTDGVI